METIISQVQSFANSANETTRRQLVGALRDIAVSLETPNDTIMRLVYQPAELVVIQIGVDLHLFQHLEAAGKPLTVQDLAEQTKADPLLLARLLRFLASFRIVKEDGEDLYSATPVTETLANPSYEGGVGHHFYFHNLCLQQLPKFLKDTGYKNVDDPFNCPFQRAMNTKGVAFIWLQHNQFELDNFQKFMRDYHEGKSVWTQVVPFKEQLKDFQAGERPLFVDVGGGMGSQCVEFKKAIGDDISGKIILQDLPETLDVAPEIPGVEKLAHDFFKPQRIKGAKFYFLRNILHDHPSHSVIQILKNITDVMSPDSVILINEVVIPNKGAHEQATAMDIAMMGSLASMERTEKQWHQLLEGECGLRIERMEVYGMFMGDAVIECVKRDN